MDVVCHIHALAALLLGKGPKWERIEGWVGCRESPGVLQKRKYLAPARN